MRGNNGMDFLLSSIALMVVGYVLFFVLGIGIVVAVILLLMMIVPVRYILRRVTRARARLVVSSRLAPSLIKDDAKSLARCFVEEILEFNATQEDYMIKLFYYSMGTEITARDLGLSNLSKSTIFRLDIDDSGHNQLTSLVQVVEKPKGISTDISDNNHVDCLNLTLFTLQFMEPGVILLFEKKPNEFDGGLIPQTLDAINDRDIEWMLVNADRVFYDSHEAFALTRARAEPEIATRRQKRDMEKAKDDDLTARINDYKADA